MPAPIAIETVRVIDDIFVQMIEAQTVEDWITLDPDSATLDDAVEELWAALELGELHLMVDGKRLQVAPVADLLPSERRVFARRYRPLVAARRRVLRGLEIGGRADVQDLKLGLVPR